MAGKSDLRIDWATHEAAKYACENWHYSRCIPKSKLVKIGIWERDTFKGVVIYGVGATNKLVKRYGLRQEQGCELVRVALRDHITPVSRIIAISLRFLKKNNPQLRLVVSFADPEQGHHGGIYQGGGWAFCGSTQSSDEYIYKGKRWQGRSFRNSHKGLENSPHVTKVKGSSKYRYLMPLDAEMRASIEHLKQPYPKRPKHCVDATSTEGEGGSIPTRTLQFEKTPEKAIL